MNYDVVQIKLLDHVNSNRNHRVMHSKIVGSCRPFYPMMMLCTTATNPFRYQSEEGCENLGSFICNLKII